MDIWRRLIRPGVKGQIKDKGQNFIFIIFSSDNGDGSCLA